MAGGAVTTLSGTGDAVAATTSGGLPRAGRDIPRTLTSFVGREDDAAVVRDLIARHRLVTLTGAGGAGKTRLGAEVASRLRDTPGLAPTDEVCWADLTQVADAALVATVVADAVGVRGAPDDDNGGQLIEQLADRGLLLVLDNCEHVIDAAAGLTERVLAGCPGVRVLATSRQPLAVTGEATYRVPSLDLPDDDVGTVHDLVATGAGRLFADRVELARASRPLRDEEASTVARICRRLDGIPFALELAAARTRLLSPTEILEGLDDRFALLTGGNRRALPRQRTLEASVSWSYRLLDGDERVLLDRLSVFSGTFDLDAAVRVCGTSPLHESQVLDVLSHLVDRSLVQADTSASRTRYRLLETVRDYARRELTDRGEASAIRDRHLDHHVTLANDAELELLDAATIPDRLEQLDATLADIRASFDWALDSHQLDAHLQMGSALIRYWLIRSHYTEARRRLGDGLLADGEVTTRTKARALSAAAMLSGGAGDAPSGLALAEQAVALARDVAEPRILHDALTYRGWNLFVTGHDARSDLHEAEQLASLIDGPTVPTRPLFRALAETDRAGLRHARQRWTTLIARCERVGDTSTLALATTLYGGQLLYAGEHDAADRLAARGAELSRQVHNHAFVANAMTIRAFVAILREDTDAADALVGPDMLTSARLGGPLAHVTARLTVAFVQHARGELAAADRSLTEIEPTLRATGYTSFIAAFEVARAMLAHDHGETSEARARMRAAFELERGRARHAQFAAWLAQLEHEHGASDEAVTLAHQALTVALERGDVWGGTAALTLLAETLHDDGDPVSATRLLATADAARSRHGTHGGPFERIARDRLREALTADLGDEEFVAVWGEGHNLGFGDAAALVRRGRGERGRPSAGWDSLTPAELDVVAQVVAGASNPEIAERLFVSRNTVKSHLSNVYRKLGFNSRSQLASEAALRGLGATAP